MKIEPQDYDDTSSSMFNETLQRKRQQNTEDFAIRRDSIGQTNQQMQDSSNEQYLLRGPSSDVMPTLIPIRNSRGFANANGPPPKRANYGARQNERSASDTDLDMFYRMSSHPDVFTHGSSGNAVAEINEKLTTMIANQNKIISQNDLILSKLNSGLNSKSHRIEQLDNILQARQKAMSQNVRSEFSEERIDKRKEINFKNGRHSSSSFLSSEGGCYYGQNEADIGHPPQSKSRRTSDGVSSVGSVRSTPKSPSRDMLSVPSMVAISNCQTSSSVRVTSSNSAMPMHQSSQANPYNMAVYVLRTGEQPQMVPVLPVQHNRPKSNTLQTDISSSLLSSHPALIYNPETRQYEASYVTGIAHANMGPRNENSDAAQKHREATWKDTANLPQKSDNIVNGAKQDHMQPNITNVVSLRRDSAEPANPTFNTSAEVTSEARGPSISAAAQQVAFSNPASPIVIEEDIKPKNLPSQEEILHLQLRSFSMRNYAVQLMRALFRPHEIMHRSVYENGERKGLDRKRLQQIKDYVFQIYPTPNKEKSLAWIECIAAMNEAIRSMK